MGACYNGPTNITPEYDEEVSVNLEYTNTKETSDILSQASTDKQQDKQDQRCKSSKACKNNKSCKCTLSQCKPETEVTEQEKEDKQGKHCKSSKACKNDKSCKSTVSQCKPVIEEEKEEKEKEFRMCEVSKHNKVDDIWIVLNNNVYDVSNFWQQHPVNPQYVFKYGGQDATDAFKAAGHSQYACKLAFSMKIGVLCPQDRKLNKQISVLNWDSLEEININSNGNEDENLNDIIRIKHINVYPVKGCRGVELESTYIDQSGVYNDRTYCFVDASTHNPINQLKYQKLSLIQPVLKNITTHGTNETEDTHSISLYYFDERTGEKNSITVKSKYDKNEMIEIEYVNSDTKILSYDQGDEISDWITNYLHSTKNILDKNKTFRFCKILRNNVRPHKEYFSLPFISRDDQPIKGVLNYSAINLASQESLNELNRRWNEKNKNNNDNESRPFGWDRWRVNIVLEGLPSAHFEDFAKFMLINNDVEMLWNRRRYLCTVPNVNQWKGVQTNEPQDTLTRYRNAVTLNDSTAKPGTNGVFFGSFFLVKKGGYISVGDSVKVRQTQINDMLRTNQDNEYYGVCHCGQTNVPCGDKNFSVKSLRQYQSYALAGKNELTHNTYHLRFELADKKTLNSLQHESLRLSIGGHYLLQIPDNMCIIRAYTPVVLDEKDNDENYFDLVVKIYANGAMTQYFKHMQIGDLINGKQYYSAIRYVQIGRFRFGDPSHFQVKHWSFDVNYINMICGGTGICPMMQIIQCIDKNRHIDQTKINIFYSNKTVNDILMSGLLNKISQNNENINVYYVITSKQDTNKNTDLEITQFGKRINADFISQYGFQSSEDCISLLCGPPRMDIAMHQICKEIGFDEKHIHTF